MRVVLCLCLMTLHCVAMQMPPTVTREQAEATLQAAFSVLGAPYVWGGQDPSGFDCSGLAIWAYNHAVPGIHWYTGDSFVDDTTAHMLFVYNVKPLRARRGVAGRFGVCHQQHQPGYPYGAVLPLVG